MKSVWSGSISFGLVNIPVKLYSAHMTKEIQLHTLCKNNHRLEYKRWCPVENREVSWDEVREGFEIEKDKYIVLEKSDLEKIKVKSSKTIEVKEFVDQNQIDPIEVNNSYYIVPKEDEKAYMLFLKALQVTGKTAVGKLTLKNKEHIAAIRFYYNILLLHTLYYNDEIIKPSKFVNIANPKVDENELSIAAEIIKRMSADLDISKYKDQYTEALKELIMSKAKGKEFTYTQEAIKQKSKDLLAGLKESLEALDKEK